ncbi:hypothetical protein OCUAc17_26080 [Acinetobacter pittii]|uniref:Uncharacterized protein n=1 Tax=Acinetobacter pittii TaxID=48296 RepID=A0A4Y3J8Q5_ACIPI|nr:hypothetical protein ACINWC141_1199 [Acinetobacter sp. WC-141]EXA84678.1 hypothetical protein J508_3887 [Acinetobacter sp. 1289694]EXR99109.1 hypothetical protein J687_2745 [Acinetobacter sp. 225588]EYT27993.1 hypothetical protein J622_01075 [Acinetobacter sp. 1564232]KCX94774.1 hypothetical protein J584_3799 [Acinetobacter sp. 72431]KCY54730.1 hypothetical protein J608_3901 [Acinetobacter baumannii 1288284]WHA53201.1 hypothetical protein OH685_08135 [Acinetobacter pittii]
MTCAEPKNKPVPTAPPIAINWIWRFLSPRFNWEDELLKIYALNKKAGAIVIDWLGIT